MRIILEYLINLFINNISKYIPTCIIVLVFIVSLLGSLAILNRVQLLALDQSLSILNIHITTLETFNTATSKDLKLIVERPSWNAYIERKDVEYHIQQGINERISRALGLLEGQVKQMNLFLFKD